MIRAIAICCAMLVLLSESLLAATTQSTVFTYQGVLSASGHPADGNYDLVFKLFDAASGGTQVGATITMTAFPVVNGAFTTDLDFPGTFSGDQRWIEVAVNGQPLLPRQAVNTVPVAQYALNAGSGAAGVQAVTVTSSSEVTLRTMGATVIPGLSVTINLPKSATVEISTYGGAITGYVDATSVVDVTVFVDGARISGGGGSERVHIRNQPGDAAIEHWGMTMTKALSAGTHTILVAGTLVSGTDLPILADAPSGPNAGQLSVVAFQN